jgi:hypothetical protein
MVPGGYVKSGRSLKRNATATVISPKSEREAIGGGSGHWAREREPRYRPGDEALLIR